MTSSYENSTAAAFDPEAIRPLGLKQFSRNIIGTIIRCYRNEGGLSPAALEYSQQHWDPDFVRKARDSEASSFRQMVGTFLLWRDQINHPQPELAIRFAFVMVALALRELILFDRARFFDAVLPVDDELLSHELTTMFLRYLGVD